MHSATSGSQMPLGRDQMPQLQPEQLKKVFQVVLQMKEMGRTDDPRYMQLVQLLQAHSSMFRQQGASQAQPAASPQVVQPSPHVAAPAGGSQHQQAQHLYQHQQGQYGVQRDSPNAYQQGTAYAHWTSPTAHGQQQQQQAIQQQQTAHQNLQEQAASALLFQPQQIAQLVEQVRLFKAIRGALYAKPAEHAGAKAVQEASKSRAKEGKTTKAAQPPQIAKTSSQPEPSRTSIGAKASGGRDKLQSARPEIKTPVEKKVPPPPPVDSPRTLQRKQMEMEAAAKKALEKRNLGTQWRRGKYGLIFIGKAAEALPVPQQGFEQLFRRSEGPLPLDLDELKEKREQEISRMISNRIMELQSKLNSAEDPVNGQSKQGLRDLIQLKALKLLGKQKQVRLAVIETHQQALLSLRDPAVVDRFAMKRYKKQSKKELKLYEKEQKKKQMEIENARRQRHQNFLRSVANHSRDFFSFHRNKYSAAAKAARAVKTHLEGIALKAEREEERFERNRLKALKANDMEAYAKLVENAKNERLRYLLKQTDEYLESVMQLVRRHQEEAVGGGVAQNNQSQEGESSESSQGDYYDLAHAVQEKITRQPSMLVGGDLKEYQLKGLQWMVSLYNNNLNGILADEMGLGKTIQTISLVTYIMEVKHNNGPFMIVVPLSTLSNWVNEFAKWAPSVITVVYKGNPQVRRDIYKEEMASGKFNVLLTTYEYVMKDKHVLRKTLWQYIIVDEGHRMKNAQSKFAQTLGQLYNSRNRILLTGTPLQNNLPELWSLLNFLLPKIFKSVENFEQWFNKPFQNYSGTGEGNELNEEEKLLIINRLHRLLRPFLLRRVKSAVIDQLPSKVEKVLRCELSAWQKIMYRQIQEKGALLVDPSSSLGKTGSRGLSNIIMQLRKICNHPYLFMEDSWPVDEAMVRCAGKFELLDRMLPKLKAAGHRVLMFSQMTQLMNILEDYFAMRGFRYLRLDGSTTADEREQRMFQFNAPDSPYFIFLLSTRAGGLGLNLATADTVIIFDSDWNPMMDAQAQDRAHRIGQKNEVRVFRLVTNSPIEEKILARATDKLNINSLVVEAGKFNAKSKDAERRAMLESLLKVEAEEGAEDNEGIVDDDQINTMMAVTDEEYELYQRLDQEREAREEREWNERRKIFGLTGKRPSRLMQEHDLPDWLIKSKEQADMAADLKQKELLEEAGRGSRKRKEVVYNDGLTDRQFTRMVEAGMDISEFEAGGKETGKKRPRSDEESGSGGSKHPKLEGGEAGLSRKHLSKKLSKCYKAVRELKDEHGRLRCQLYLDKPSRTEYQDYYKIIKDPIDLRTIHRQLKDHAYSTVQDFEEDMRKLFNNARLYNRPDSIVYQDANEMEAVLNRKLKKLKDSLRSRMKE